MNCPTGEQLRALLDERLADAQRDAVERHTENCVDCQQRLAQLSGDAFSLPPPSKVDFEPDAAFLRRLKQETPSASARLGTGSRPVAEPVSPPARPSVSGYEILQELGRGGMGVVYRARQLSLGRLVALKMILDGAQASVQDRQRFRAEAEAVARLQHPNIVQVHEVGESAGHPFFSMELVDGLSLAQRLDGKPLIPEEAAATVETLARAIQYAHECGIIHRDLKPANILLAGSDDSSPESGGPQSGVRLHCLASHARFVTPKIADFGLAKQLGAAAGQTRSSTVLGTPNYMAPEQVAGAKKVGPAADVYALGAILYECLTGRPPFRDETPLETLLQVTSQEPIPPSRLTPKVPRDLETICLKCLEKDPHARYASARGLAEDLRRFLEGNPIAARPVGLTGRLWRWTRRKPVLAGLIGTVAALVLLVAVGSSIATLSLQATLADSERNRVRAEDARLDAQDKLWLSYREKAHAIRLSGQVGQRFEGLRTLAEATRIARNLHVDEDGILQLRNEAIGCLALADLRFERTLLANYPEKSPHNYWLAFDPDFRYFVYGDRRGNLSIRSVDDARETDRVDGPDEAPAWLTVRFSPDGRWLYRDQVVSSRPDVAVWEFRDGKLGRKITFAHSCVFSPDSRRLAGAHPDGSISVYELDTGRELTHFAALVGAKDVVFDPTGRELAVTLRRDTHRVAVFDWNTGKEVAHRYEHDREATGVAWRSDGRLLAVACDDQRIYVWDHSRRRLQSVLEGHSALGINVKFSHSGEFLVSTGWDGTTRLWDPISGRQLLQSDGHFVDIGRGDRQLALIKSGPDTIDLGLWEFAGGWECRTLHHGSVGNRTPRPDHWGPTSLDFAANGRLLASSHVDGVRLWDLTHFAEVGHLPNPETAQVQFRAGGDSLFTYGAGGLCRWPIRSTSVSSDESPAVSSVLEIGLPEVFEVPGNWVHANLASDRAGQRLLAVDFPRNQALLFALDQSGQKFVLDQPGVNGCAISPDGRWAFTWVDTESKEFNVQVWSTADGKPAWSLPKGERFSYLTPDGRWLVTAPPGDAPLRRWEIGSWQPGGTLPRPATKGLNQMISPDGTVLVSIEPGPLRFYHTSTGQELASLEAPRNVGSAVGARFSPDGAWFAVATGSHSIQVWDLRALRRSLVELGLDWDLPPAAPPAANNAAEPIHITVSPEVAGYLNQSDFKLGQEHLQSKEWQAAIDSFTKVIQRDAARSDAHHQRAWAHAELEHWRQAAADFAVVSEATPAQAAGIWYFRAVTHLADDDQDGYRRACAGMLERYGQTTVLGDVYWIAWTCSLGPHGAADPAVPIQRAAQFVADAPHDSSGLAVLGAALYRAGRYDEAVERLHAALAAYGADQVPRQPVEYSWLFLAMAEHRRGNAETARQWFDRVNEAHKAHGQAETPGGDSMPWNRRLTLQILQREAETVLAGSL